MISKIRLYPNPASNKLFLQYNLPYKTENNGLYQIKIMLFDISGKKLKTIPEQQQYPGLYRIPVETSSLAASVYFIRMGIDKHPYTYKFIKQ